MRVVSGEDEALFRAGLARVLADGDLGRCGVGTR
jgi:hypothetical protein